MFLHMESDPLNLLQAMLHAAPPMKTSSDYCPSRTCVVFLTNRWLFSAHILYFDTKANHCNGYIFNEIGHEHHIQRKSVPKIKISGYCTRSRAPLYHLSQKAQPWSCCHSFLSFFKQLQTSLTGVHRCVDFPFSSIARSVGKEVVTLGCVLYLFRFSFLRLTASLNLWLWSEVPRGERDSKKKRVDEATLKR